MKNAGTRVDQQNDAGWRGRGVERSDFLRGAVFKQTKIALAQAANPRPVGRRDSAGRLHQRDARADRAYRWWKD